MKNYIVFSDIHGDRYSLNKLSKMAVECDGAFFAGDGLSILKDFPAKTFYAVKGNCDMTGESEIIVEIDGVKILLTHGHFYGVKSGYLNLVMRAKEAGVSAVIFGHTHIAEVFTEEGILFINPGSCSYYGAKKTYAVMFIHNQKPSAYINEIN